MFYDTENTAYEICSNLCYNKAKIKNKIALKDLIKDTLTNLNYLRVRGRDI